MIHVFRKSGFAMLLILGIFLSAKAQWLKSNVYDRPLQEVLDQIETYFGVKLDYESKNIKGRLVVKAPWLFYTDIEETLDNVLRPLDLRWTRTDAGTYEIKKWEYFRKPFAEGGKHLHALQVSYPDRESMEARKAELNTHIMKTLGLTGLKKCPLNPIVSALRKYDGYTVENIALEVLPGVWVCGSLYKPTRVKGKIPLFLSPHGHFYNKEDNSIPNERGRYRPDQQIRCAMLARMGVAVFSYDMFGWGDSSLAFTLQDHRSDLGLVMQTWQSIRVLDYLCRQPWADTSRVGVTGASGGGTQVMLIAALDNRITLSVPVVMMSSHFFGGCPCESGLPIHFPENGLPSNNAEIAALCAPRPQLCVSDGNDWTVTTPDIEMPYLKLIYNYYGKASEIENVHLPHDQHDYGMNKREAMYDFTARKFGLNVAAVKNKAGNWDETKVTIEPVDAMKVFHGKLPAHAVIGAENLRILLKTYRE